MQLSNKQKRIVASNLKAIREFYGCKNSAELFIRLNSPKYLSQSTLEKIENNWYKELSEETVRKLSGATGFRFDELLSPTFADFLNTCPKMDEQLEVNEKELSSISELISRMLKIFFPLIPLENIEEENEDFYIGLNNAEKFIKHFSIDQEGINYLFDAQRGFLRSGTPEGLVNLLSLRGYALTICIGSSFKAGWLDMFLKDYDDALDFSSKVFAKGESKEEKKKKLETKLKYLDIFEGLIEDALKQLNKFYYYKDFVSYYLALRYYLALMDNEKTNMDDFEMYKCGLSLMKELSKAGNQYAEKLVNFKF